MRGRVLAAVLLASLLVAGASTAARIVGSNHGDTLRGTKGADRIYGKSGPDTLLGLAGADELYPGPGADVVRCGAGRDTVHADWADTIARDCERVLHATPAAVGVFAGTSTQNEAVTLDVLPGGRTLTRFRINSLNQSCTPANELATFGALDFGDTVFPLAKSGSFTASYAGPGTVGGYAAQLDVRVSGRLTGRKASGVARVDTTFTDKDGTAFACSSGDVGWSAALP
jgi:Ca2+-binding RTX toxin-like protein